MATGLYICDADGFEVGGVSEFVPVYCGDEGVVSYTLTGEGMEAPGAGARLGVVRREDGEVLARFVCLRALPWRNGTVRIIGRPG